MNTKIYIAPSRLKSSETLAAEQMSFKFFANVSVDSEEVRRTTGRLFQVAGPDTVKSHRRAVVLVRGTTSVPLSADRSCHLPTTDETGIHVSAK